MLPTPGSAAASLASRLLNDHHNTISLIILSGARDAGKTAFCLELASRGREAGLQVGGLVSPAVVENGRKVAYDILLLPENKRRRLAELSDRTGSDVTVGGWHFDPAALRLANEHLEQLSGCEWLIIDELGPLEFDQRKGLRAALALIDRSRFKPSIVAIRPALVERAVARWPWAECLTLTAFGTGSSTGDRQP